MIFCECRNTMFFNCLFVTFFTSLGQNHIRRMTHMRRSAVFSAALRTGGGRVGGRAVRKHSRRRHIVSAFATPPAPPAPPALPHCPRCPRSPRCPAAFYGSGACTAGTCTAGTYTVGAQRSIRPRGIQKTAFRIETEYSIGNRAVYRKTRSVQ